MATFLVTEFTNTILTSSSTTNLFTVPSGHGYVLKTFFVELVQAASSAASYRFELSDTAGANFMRVSPHFDGPGSSGNFLMDLGGNAVADITATQTLDADDEARAGVVMTFKNVTLDAGQVLRIVWVEGNSSDTIQILINGIDHTE